MLYGQAPLPASAGSFRSRILSVASGTEKQNLPAIFASRKFFESGRIATLLRTKLCERHERDPQADKVLVYSIKDGRPVPNAQVQHELSVIPVIIQNLPVFVSLQQGSNRFPNMYNLWKPYPKVGKNTTLCKFLYEKCPSNFLAHPDQFRLLVLFRRIFRIHRWVQNNSIEHRTTILYCPSIHKTHA